jgi:hypothetical protein
LLENGLFFADRRPEVALLKWGVVAVGSGPQRNT